MPLHRERTDPVRTPDDLGLVHRRWVVSDDIRREVGLAAAARLWHAFFDLQVLDRSQEVFLYRLQLPGGSQEESGLPAVASAGALLAGASAATAVSQVVHPEDGFRDPYLVPGDGRSEEHTSELQSRFDLVCRLRLENKNYLCVHRG